MKCFYPPPPYDGLENIIKNLDDPDKESWKSYTVLCLLNAEKLKEKNVDDLTFPSFSESDLGPQGTELETCIKRNQLKQRQEEMSSNFNSIIKKEYSIPEDSVLSLLDNIFTRSAEWGQMKISNTLSDDLDDSYNE
ncbi:hypothetical protein HCN44_011037 [Aphidius gifuensis]|uniref:Uncharacterized protein n=1 Tax=Aphidius gifuensis TaxID=684658 RepID=A0A835CWR5_APHGI|nr:hypothetical protein HCN44_011037 [Aphidius gifuensis]